MIEFVRLCIDKNMQMEDKKQNIQKNRMI